jgi:hypothetical protein
VVHVPAAHARVAGSEHVPPVQQGSSAAPQLVHVPPAQASVSSAHDPSAQQSSPDPPHVTHEVPSQARPAPQLAPSQHEAPSTPHVTQDASTHESPDWQLVPVQHACPAPPQSVCTMHVPASQTSFSPVHAGQHAPAGQTHAPSTHSRPSVHAVLHARPASTAPSIALPASGKIGARSKLHAAKRGSAQAKESKGRSKREGTVGGSYARMRLA